MEAKVEKKTKFSLTMKNLKLIFLFIFLGSLLLLPLVSLAGTYKVDGKTATYEGLVPCGKSEKGPGETDEVTMPCQFCHFFVMFDGIVDFVLELVIIIGVLMLTIGGFMFLFAGGSPALLARAKSILTSTAIGLVIIFAAYLIIGTILQAIGLSDWTKEIYQNWWKEGIFQIECQIKPFVEKEKEDYQKKITATEKEIAQLEEEKGQLEKDLVAAKKRGDTDTVQQIADAIANINEQLAAKGEEEKEKKEIVPIQPITLIKINKPDSLGYKKTCNEVCKEAGFTCENVGLDAEARNKQMWDVTFFNRCVRMDGIGCNTLIQRRVGNKTCEFEGYLVQWTRCRCIKY